jgi:hypothetical protein
MKVSHLLPGLVSACLMQCFDFAMFVTSLQVDEQKHGKNLASHFVTSLQDDERALVYLCSVFGTRFR